MNYWYKIVLSNDDVIEGKHRIIQDKFGKIFMESLAPKDMTLYAMSKIQQGMELYFSPGSIEYTLTLIEEYGGVECDKPQVKDIVFLVGNDEV